MATQRQIYTETLASHHDLTEHIESIVSQSGIFRHAIRPWWRGHARQCNWKLMPLVYRVDQGEPSYEAALARKFMLDAPVRYRDCPAEGDIVEWLQLMRHYGLPTRLLDWTQSPLIALFFAVSDPKDDSYPGALWALNGYELNEFQAPGLSICFPDNELVRQIAEKALAFGTAKWITVGPQVLAFFPKLIDNRMLLQQSVFTIHATGTPLEEQANAENFLAKLEIPHAVKETLRALLKNLGFTERQLFPDLDHLARDIQLPKSLLYH